MVTRTLTNAGAPLLFPNGSPAARIKIGFTLVRNSGVADDVFDATTGERIAPGPIIATTDDSGVFSVSLWPTSRGDAQTFYNCIVPLPGVKDILAPLPDEAGDYSWIQFKLGATGPSAPPWLPTPLEMYDVSAWPSLADAIADIATYNKTLWISTVVSCDDLDTAGRGIRILLGGMININPGQTLTINGSFQAGLYQCFAGDGAVSGLKESRPEWFGAGGDGVTDDTVAIQNALNAGAVGKSLNVYLGNHVVSASLNVPANVTVSQPNFPTDQIKVAATFTGAWVFVGDDPSANSHNTMERIYIDFSSNAAVGGYNWFQPYDYSHFRELVGNESGSTFMQIGNTANVSQSVSIERCLVYASSGITVPMVKLIRFQEGNVIGNKWLAKTSVKSNTSIVEGDRVTNTLFLNNSFANSTSEGLTLKATAGIRVSGNKIIGNTYENISGTASMSITGYDATNEGEYNVLHGNAYLNSTRNITLSYVVGTQITDAVAVTNGTGARRTGALSYAASASSKNSTGNFLAEFDGAEMRIPGASSTYSAKQFKFRVDDRADYWNILWNASSGTDLGLQITAAGVNLVNVQPDGDVYLYKAGKGLLVTSPDGLTTKRLGINNAGALLISTP